MSTGNLTSAGRVDAARAVILPGPGAVVRLPGLLCLLRLEPTTDSAADGHLARLVEICTEIAGADSTAPGRPLARRLARWLGSLDPGPDFGTVTATETGIAIFLHGGVDAVAGRERYSAADSGAWLDRLVPHPDGPIVLLPTEQPTPRNGAARAVFDLRSGVVPAGAVLLVPRAGAVPVSVAAAAPDRPVSEPEPVSPTPEPPPSEPEPEPARFADQPTVVVQPAAETARRISTILGVQPEEAPRPPLDDRVVRKPPPPSSPPPAPRPSPTKRPTDAPPTVLDPAAANGAPMAYGHLCSRDHLNDPRNHFCVLCGIRMNERTGVEVLGVRPPLGLLVFDDGSTYTLDADYLLGRSPEADPRVQGGELRALPVDDPEAQLSRGHLVIKVEGWDVTAIDESRNGTLVARPAEESWSRLSPRQPLRLLPGTRVRVGGRSFVFESPSGVR